MSSVHMANGFDPDSSPDLSPEAADLLRRRSQVLSSSYRLFYSEPVDVVCGQGSHLFDAAGNDYLDVYNNVPGIGHSHPRVTEYVSAQLATLNTHTRYLTEAVVSYSEDLLATFPTALDRITYACSGSEAIDLAVRLARFATGHRGVIVTATAYHGTTELSAGLSPSLGENNPLGPDVVTVEAPDGFRDDPATASAEFAARIRTAAEDLEERGIGLAAVLVDSVLSSDGVQPEPAGFLAEAATVAHEFGGLWIADEVQPGFGRTGTMWGFERHTGTRGDTQPGPELPGLEAPIPDIAVLGKPMGNGMPISAVVTRAELGEEFGRRVRYFNTFGGNPVSIAAARAVLEVVREEDLPGHASTTGAALAQGLSDLAQDFPLLGQVRQAGLFLGVEVVDPEAPRAADPARASAVVNGLRDRRVLISASGPHANVLKIRPPLVFDAADTDRFLTSLADTLASLRA